MDKKTSPSKHYLWVIPLCILVGVFLGIGWDFENKFEIVFTVENDTKDWWDESLYEMENLTESFKNICCYPPECPQSKNNPEVCSCIFMVECYEGDNYGRPIFNEWNTNWLNESST